MEWLEDREKEGEMYTNSYTFAYCLKCFKKEKKVEAWVTERGRTVGYEKIFTNLAEAVLEYRVVKGLEEKAILSYLQNAYRCKT